MRLGKLLSFSVCSDVVCVLYFYVYMNVYMYTLCVQFMVVGTYIAVTYIYGTYIQQFLNILFLEDKEFQKVQLASYFTYTLQHVKGSVLSARNISFGTYVVVITLYFTFYCNAQSCVRFLSLDVLLCLLFLIFNSGFLFFAVLCMLFALFSVSSN